jgi:serine protease AprX
MDVHRRSNTRPRFLAVIAAAAVLAPAPVAALRMETVIVRAQSGALAPARDAVRTAGGRVVRPIGILDGFVAELPQGRLDVLNAARGVEWAVPDRRLRLLADEYDAKSDIGSMYNTASIVGAQSTWKSGITGRGVDVALIDSGVTAVTGLEGRVVNGADLSFESQRDETRYVDTFGHGTHMAGIIAGRDRSITEDYGRDSSFFGIAPESRIVSVKVADAHGVTDVSQVLAAIDWVVQHRTDNGMNIRVLNLSFGTDSSQDYRIDPLAFAVEVAWRKGIVVVASAGNGGHSTTRLADPAYDPYVLAVGAADPHGTIDSDDDVVAAFSSAGIDRTPDLVAPGRSIQSLRVPGSTIDQAYPSARLGTRFFRGSGTSQAAAVVSGAAALVAQQRPDATPDQIKALLQTSARPLAEPASLQGAGELNVRPVWAKPTPVTTQTWARSTGTGSLEASRGSAHVVRDGVALEGERDIFGAAFDASAWSSASAAGNSWSGGSWNGNTWSGNSWSGNSWSSSTWSGNSWSGNSWSGNSWSGNAWSGNSWSANSWSDALSSSTWSSAGWGSDA